MENWKRLKEIYNELFENRSIVVSNIYESKSFFTSSTGIKYILIGKTKKEINTEIQRFKNKIKL